MPGNDGFFTVFYLVAALVVGTFVFIVGSLVWRGVSNLNSPKEQWSGKVVAKRQQVSGSNDSTSTAYFVTFETPAGERREFAVKGRQYGQLVEGDQGLAQTQGTWFLQFDRVR